MYFSPLSGVSRTPTGVGQHIAHMSAALRGAEGVSDVNLLASRSAYCRSESSLHASILRLEVLWVPIPEWMFRRVQMMTSLLPIDCWAGEADWIYCPKEQPVAVRKCRLAVMVHDLASLDPGIDGMPAVQPRLALRWRMTMKRIIERAHLIATASEFTAQRIRELCGIGDDPRLCVIGNGVSPTYRQEPGPGDADVLGRHGLTRGGYLLSVGSLTWRKGGDTMLELARELSKRRHDLRIVVSGRRHDAELVERFNQMKREDSQLPIDLLGYVPDDDLAALYRGAHTFVFPSRYEGFGMPVLEAMACGTPVICSDAAALPEVAGDAAVLVKPGSAMAILDALRSLEGNAAARAGWIEKGYRRAAEYTWERAAGRLVGGMLAYKA